MKLPTILTKIIPQKEGEKEYFLALEVKTKEIKAALWQKENGRTAFVNFGKAPYSGEWEEAVGVADEAIVEASANIPQEKIEKVIFGVPLPWIEENKILAPHLGNLKKLCDQLSLKPLGFVVISEAVVDYLKQIEGVPPTALLLELEEKTLTLTLVKAGKIEGVEVAERESGRALPEQVEEILKTFSAEILPSRILLYDGEEDLEKIKGDLLAYHWSEKLPFLHLPKVEILEKDFDIKAVSSASGGQIETTVFAGEVLPEKEPPLVEKVAPAAPAPEEDFGFVKGRDILEVAKKEEEIPFPEEKLEEEVPAALPIKEKEEKRTEFPPRGFKLPSLPSLPVFHFPHLGPPSFNLPLGNEIKWVGVATISILLLLGGAFFWAWWYLPKAEVKIWIQTKPLEKEAILLVVPELQGREEGKISGKFIEIEEKTSGRLATTGKKTVGDPAKGKMTIYNKTENEKKFPKGTVFLGPQDLKFTLDEEVTVASTTAFATNLSSISGKATAGKIGEEGNLSSGTNFSFKDYPTSSYFAKADGDFSGGTSREIAVVARSDQEKLVEDLSAQLKTKAEENLQTKLGPGEKLIKETLSSTVKEKKFDQEIGGEATELNLTLAMSFKATIYNEEDLKERLSQVLKEAAPSGFDLDKDEIKIEVTSVEIKDQETVLKLISKVSLRPKLNLEEIRENIAGKKKTPAEDYLRNLGGVGNVEIIINFPLPIPLPNLPHFPQNIKIEVIPS